ncbi:hypothetical protein M0R45_010949 [Rubus argutus]|uniref:KIB1-4 beta-propeller domain-containing protein n=1 Tax=Rubus argutus TaxID=59490 RepID=A0AAW1Y9A4_RUBAR
MTAPMLLICANKRHRWNLYSTVDDKVFDLQLSIPKKRYCGSSFGWLIYVDKNLAVTLINPFLRFKGRTKKENSIIRLPPLPPPTNRDDQRPRWSRQCEHYVFKATMLRKDTKWTSIHMSVDIQGVFIQEVACVEDKFYTVDRWNRLSTFGVTAESNSDLELVACLTRPRGVDKKYLVYSNERELLMLIRCMVYTGGKRATVRFLVYELNFDECEWFEKHNLGDDVALFVGDNSSISVSASKSGCLSNCIYFIHDYDLNGYDIDQRYHLDFGVYNVKSQSISQPCTQHARDLVEMTDYQPIWVLPTLKL